MEILQAILKKLNRYNISWTEDEIEFVLAEVDQYIKNYCNISVIPEELVFVRSNLVLDYIRHIESTKPVETGVDITNTTKVGPLTSIKSGNIQYNFSDNSTNGNHISNAHKVDLDSLCLNYINQLNKFRRNVW